MLLNHIGNFHANNRHLTENAFMSYVRTSGQTISFCGVNVHFHNGIAEKQIRDIQELSINHILYTKSR